MSRAFLVVGESLVDIVVPAVGETTYAVGGSPMNVAVGLARLGVPTQLVTQIGDDEHGGWVADHLARSEVALAGESVLRGRRTNTATATLDASNAASYEFDLSWDLPLQSLPDVTGLHVGSLGASLPPGRTAVSGLVSQANDRDLLVSYDPNVRPSFVDDPAQEWRDLQALAGQCRLVKLSDEDLAALRPGESETAMCAELLRGERTELVLLTRGARGALAMTQRHTVEAAAPPIRVVDTVGAGDSFMAAALAILLGWNVAEAGAGALAALETDRLETLLSGAMAAAALTCSRRGANPPSRRELAARWPNR